MPTLEEIEKALRAADAAGNIEDAKTLAKAYTDAQSATSSGNQTPWPERIARPGGEIPHIGYRAQVAQTMAGNGPQSPAVPSWGQLGRSYSDIAKGAAIGAPAAAIGIPGDIESLGRTGLALARAPVSQETLFPTTQSTGNAFEKAFGIEHTPDVAAGRVMGGFAGPYLAKKGIDLAKAGVGWAAKQALGAYTGAGAPAFEQAYQTGKTGGQSAEAFAEAVRRGGNAGEIVDLAKDAVKQLRRERSAIYEAGRTTTFASDPTILDFAPINEALRKASDIGQFHGKVTIGGAEKVWKAISDIVDDWRTSDPAIFHTPEGLDALKQRIGNLAFDGELATVAGHGKPGEKIVGAVYNAIKNQIVKQAPGYAKVMKGYADASDEIYQIEKTLSLTPQASVDTSLRKLQSILRNNANTNYGQRVALGNVLNKESGGQLMPKLAGQMLSSARPRGLQTLIPGAAAAYGMTTLNPAVIPPILASSPRLMGELAHALGRSVGATENILSLAARGDPASLRTLMPHVARLNVQLADALAKTNNQAPQ